MAEIRSIEMKGEEIFINLTTSKEEYNLLHQHTKDLILVPAGEEFLNLRLTTGKIGNSNRIMLPKRILEKNEIKTLEKKVEAKIFTLNGDVFLLIRLKKSDTGIPKFGD